MFEWISSLFPKQAEADDMFLLVGLGNPGDKYAGNRHNIGFMVLDRIAGDIGAPAFKSKFQGLYTEGRIAGHKVGLLKPQVFMNESGRSVGAAAAFYKIAPERIYVYHDELDLEPGKMKARIGGGLAGHNGLKSIKAHLGTDAFWRVRLGIGHPGDKDRVSGYVLSDFSKAEQKWLPDFIDASAGHCGLLLDDKADDYMTRVAER